MEMQSTKRENVWIDLMKMMCALIVLAGHSYLTDVTHMQWFLELTYMAVMLFFAFSGYYMAKNKTLADGEHMKKFTSHMIDMILFWGLVYGVWDALFVDKTDPEWLILYAKDCMKDIANLGSGHLWYIQNLLFVAMLLYCLKKEQVAFREIIVVWLVGSVLECHLAKALLGVWLGMYMAQPHEKLAIWKKWLIFIVGCVGCGFVYVTFLAMHGFPNENAEMFINFMQGIGFIAFTYLILDADIRFDAKYEKIAKYMRKMSTCIYLVHMACIKVSMALVKHLFPELVALGEDNIAWCGAIIGFTLLLSLAASAIIIALSEKKTFRWLKHIY